MATELEQIARVVGAENLFVGNQIEDRYRYDSMSRYFSRPQVVVRPRRTEQVAEIVRLANRLRLPIVPFGGQTGTTGGTMAEDGLKLSFELMNTIHEIDERSMTMTVDAGVTIQAAQEAAEARGLLLPLDLGSRGTATVGGTISTNAGGTRVLRWGMMRDMVLGLEAVLADGSIASSLTKVLKDNAGYNWKQLLIGSEGTLGLVTKAVLRLRQAPKSAQTALVAVRTLDDAIRVMRTLDGQLAGRLSSFELMWLDFYDHVSESQLAKRPRALPTGYPLYCLIEALGAHPEEDSGTFETSLQAMFESQLLLDAVIAQSERERQNLWAVRDDLLEAFAALGDWVAYDVSMAHEDMQRFIDESRQEILARFPKARVMYYGHVGDGNMHLVTAAGRSGADVHHMLDVAVYGAVRNVGGSISGEHGIGLAKKEFMPWSRSASEIALMKTLKRAMDPNNILNPGKVVDLGQT